MTSEAHCAGTAPDEAATGSRWLATWPAVYLAVLAWLGICLGLLIALTMTYA